MVRFYTSNYNYDYPFPAVSLAYFLRYPNPYSTHVLSTDVISRHYDPTTQRLYTTRLHLKQSRLPPAVMKLLPKNILSGGPGRGVNGEAQNLILEKSVVDAREGWMETETRNLAYTGILSVVEKQRFVRPAMTPNPTGSTMLLPGPMIFEPGQELSSHEVFLNPARTDVETTVTFVSRLGQQKQGLFRRWNTVNGDEEEPKRGFLSSISTGALQRTIEATGMQRTRNALVKSKEGMNVVLERMRLGGLSAVLEGMRRDRELVLAGADGGPAPSLHGLGRGSDLDGGIGSGHQNNQTGSSRWRSIWRSGVEKEPRRDDKADK